MTEEALIDGGFKILYSEGYIFAAARFIKECVYLIIASQEEDAKEVPIPIGLLGVTEDWTIIEVFGETIKGEIVEGVYNVMLPSRKAYLLKMTKM